MVDDISVYGDELYTHSKPELANICWDCPVCGREEWGIVDRIIVEARVRCPNAPNSEYTVVARYNQENQNRYLNDILPKMR